VRKKERDHEKKGVDKSNQKNLKAFTYNSLVRANKGKRRTLDRSYRREHIPINDRVGSADTVAPHVVAVIGPPRSGKSTIIKSLVKHYTKRSIPHVKGPITVVVNKKKRITFIECPNDINAMCDVAKVADLALVVIDAAFGFEMEVFEFLNILKTHGFPKVMGVLTHLDHYTQTKQLNRAKKTLKSRFWTEIVDGAKLFYFSGLQNGKYTPRETLNLARFISVTKFRPLTWRSTHAYVCADRYEDVTPPADVAADANVNRTISVYGYVRGTYLKHSQSVHMLGVGDFPIAALAVMDDPCPLPDQNGGGGGGGGDGEDSKIAARRRSLKETERAIYAPMGDIGALLYDEDAVYINIGDRDVTYTPADAFIDGDGNGGADGDKGGSDAAAKAKGRNHHSSDDAPAVTHVNGGEGVDMVRSLASPSTTTLDASVDTMGLRLFKGSKAITAKDVSRAAGGGGGGGSDDNDSGDDEHENGDGSDDEEDGDANIAANGDDIFDRL
jgi:ribosome biogenesis protein BMS1